MYIKFCRSYGEDKKDEASKNLSPELSVELEGGKGKGKQTEGNMRAYRAACLFLSIICLVLLVAVILLSMKLQTGSTVCLEREHSAPADKGDAPLAQRCSQEECLDILPTHLNCGRCPAGWLFFRRSCFYLSTYRLNWDKSQSNCTARGGALAVVTSLKAQNFLIEKGKMEYWIGLRRKGATWTWVDDTVLGESYWEDVPENDCGILSNRNPPEKNWLTSPCNFVSFFICQLQL
ncbi:C-type lectin domain family 4 member C isoform X2 [Clinocottus analis]|uniref:C-type lectin domain family 4 member C isoform X2 n=1 Tax=Clinocottus analis TaxID=304258 RepID=UPI0035BEFAE7